MVSMTAVTGGSLYKTFQPYTAMSGFLSDLDPLSGAPVGNPVASDCATVGSYSRTYPLATGFMFGVRSGSSANFCVVTMYQRSFPPTFMAYGSGTTLTVTSMLTMPNISYVPVSISTPILIGDNLSVGLLGLRPTRESRALTMGFRSRRRRRAQPGDLEPTP